MHAHASGDGDETRRRVSWGCCCVDEAAGAVRMGGCSSHIGACMADAVRRVRVDDANA